MIFAHKNQDVHSSFNTNTSFLSRINESSKSKQLLSIAEKFDYKSSRQSLSWSGHRLCHRLHRHRLHRPLIPSSSSILLRHCRHFAQFWRTRIERNKTIINGRLIDRRRRIDRLVRNIEWWAKEEVVQNTFCFLASHPLGSCPFLEIRITWIQLAQLFDVSCRTKVPGSNAEFGLL